MPDFVQFHFITKYHEKKARQLNRKSNLKDALDIHYVPLYRFEDVMDPQFCDARAKLIAEYPDALKRIVGCVLTIGVGTPLLSRELVDSLHRSVELAHRGHDHIWSLVYSNTSICMEDYLGKTCQ